MIQINEPSDDRDVIFIDETNSVVTGPRPMSEFMRKLIRERLEKEKRLLELKEKMYGKQDERKRTANRRTAM